MAIVASQMVGVITIQGATVAEIELTALGKATDEAGLKFAALAGGAVLIAGAAIVGFGAKAVQMAADFQQGVVRLQTGAGDVQDSFNTLSNGIKQVAVSTGVATGPLIQAMYLILSSGQRGAQALDTLTVAAKGAQIEQANVADVANTLSGVMTNYGTKIFGATQYMNGLMYAVAHGKITLQDLATSMGPIDPIARHLGVSFSDLAAAMTTQTNAMIPANIAATGLRFLMQGLENPTKKANDAMAAMGLNSITVAEEMKKSLPDALEMIYNAALKAGPAGSVPFNRALADMVGGIRGTTAFMALTGPHFADFAKNAAGIAASMKSGATDVNGWALVQGNFNLQMDKAKASLEVLGITIGQLLLPVMTRIVAAVTPIIVGFTQWIASGQAAHTAMQIVANVVNFAKGVFEAVSPTLHVLWKTLQDLGSFLLATFQPVWKQMVATWQSQVLPALKNLWAALEPLMPLFKAIGGLIIAVVLVALGLLTGAIGGVVKALAGLLQGVTIIIGGVVKIFSGMVQIVSGILSFFYDLITGNFKKIGSDLGRIMSGIGSMFSGIWDVIKGIFIGAFQSIIGFVSGFIQGVVGFFQHLASILVGHSIIPDMINAIVGWFVQLPGRALGAIASLAGRLAGFFGGLASQALSWGWNIISNLASGIINGIGSTIGNAMSAVGTFIHDHLPSSRAKRGPLRDLPEQSAMIPAQIAQGILSGQPAIQRAMAGMLRPLSTSVNVGTSFSGGSYLPSGVSVPFAGGFSTASGAGSAASAQPIILQIDGYRFATIMMPRFVQAIRNATGVTVY